MTGGDAVIVVDIAGFLLTWISDVLDLSPNAPRKTD